ncbi:hypothetical protein AS890_03810 [Rhizobium anhuiense bv. trifolii]|nr:hypothetical protein AS890_03810 [Rhizobium anhuiense bv. trifolii]
MLLYHNIEIRALQRKRRRLEAAFGPPRYGELAAAVERLGRNPMRMPFLETQTFDSFALSKEHHHD